MHDPLRQERLETLFDSLTTADPRERDAILAQATRDDPQLAAEAVELLRCLQAAPDHLEHSVFASAGLPGAAIGQFRIGRLLGEGGMGKVFEAHQEFPARRVALKIIRPGIVSAAQLKRFELEAHALAQLKHPGIAAIYEAGSFDSQAPGSLAGPRPYFAMELIEGVTLDAFAAGLDPRRVASLVAAVADAVHHAHERGIIHRDLKPGNILVEGHGDTARPRVLDFGVARLTPACDTPALTITAEVGQIVGTVAYMSPEQLHGQPADTRSDIYALGVILYRLLAGHLPHPVEGKSLLHAAQSILNDAPVRLKIARPGLPTDLVTIAEKAIDPDRARRYSSAAELAADLRRFLAHEPVAARPATLGYLAFKFARRHRVLVAAAALLAMTVAGAATSLAILYRREQSLRHVADDALRRARHEMQRQEATLSFLVNDSFGAAAPSRKGHTARILDVLDDAAAAVPSRFADDAPLRAHLRVTLGHLYYATAQPQKARPLAELALAEAAPDDALTRAAAWLILGQCGLETGADVEACEHFQRAVQAANNASSDAQATDLLREARFALAETLQKLNRHEEAEPLLRQLLADEPSRSDRALGARLSLAASLGARNRSDEARQILAQAVEIVHDLHLESSPVGLAALNNYANMLLKSGRAAEAADIAVEVMNGAQSAFPPGHPSRAFAALTAANALSAANRHDEARVAAADAARMIKAARDPADPMVEHTELVAARICRAANDLPGAADHLAAALRARLLAAGPGDSELAVRAAEYRDALQPLTGVRDRVQTFAAACRIAPDGGPERKARFLANLALALRAMAREPQDSYRPLVLQLVDEARSALPASSRQTEDAAILDAAAKAE